MNQEKVLLNVLIGEMVYKEYTDILENKNAYKNMEKIVFQIQSIN